MIKVCNDDNDFYYKTFDEALIGTCINSDGNFSVVIPLNKTSVAICKTVESISKFSPSSVYVINKENFLSKYEYYILTLFGVIVATEMPTATHVSTFIMYDEEILLSIDNHDITSVHINIEKTTMNSPNRIVFVGQKHIKATISKHIDITSEYNAPITVDNIDHAISLSNIYRDKSLMYACLALEEKNTNSVKADACYICIQNTNSQKQSIEYMHAGLSYCAIHPGIWEKIGDMWYLLKDNEKSLSAYQHSLYFIPLFQEEKISFNNEKFIYCIQDKIKKLTVSQPQPQ